MSVLLIGADSQTYTTSFKIKRKKKSQKEVLKQEEYRDDLKKQIFQKIVRVSREKQVQRWMDIKREQNYQRQIWKLKRMKRPSLHIPTSNPEQSSQEQPQSQQKQTNQIPIYATPQRTKKKSVQFELPQLYHQQEYQSTYHKAFITPIKKQKDRSKHTPRKLKTQQNQYKNRGMQLNENPELKYRRIREEEDRKIGEVYSFLNDSIDIFNGNHSNSNKNTRRFSTLPQAPSPDNPPAHDQFYSLPLHHNELIQAQARHQAERQREWQQWYRQQQFNRIKAEINAQNISAQVHNKIMNQNRLKQL